MSNVAGDAGRPSTLARSSPSGQDGYAATWGWRADNPSAPFAVTWRRWERVGVRLRVVVGGSLLAGWLVIPLTLTALRLTQPVNSTAIQLVGLAPVAMPLYVSVLLMAMVPVVRHRGRTPFLIPAATALLGLALHAVWFAPQVTGDLPVAADDAVPITVMASNLLAGRGDGESLLRTAADLDVDVLVLVEVTPSAFEALEANGQLERYPYRAGSPDHSVHGTLVLSRLRLGEPERVSTAFGTWRVKVGDDLTLLAVHTSAPTNPERWRADHRTLLASVRAHPPDLVLGDLNATADHQPMQRLADEGLREAAELTNDWQPTWPANNLGAGLARHLPPLARIDQVLVGPDLVVLSSRTVDIDDTDHLAVVARVASARTAD
jgi:endonuclease/exonuclease/phosphatase family metal-dependent hydrolase